MALAIANRTVTKAWYRASPVIRAYLGDKVVFGEEVPLEAPANFQVNVNNSEAELTWDPSDGATDYDTSITVTRAAPFTNPPPGSGVNASAVISPVAAGGLASGEFYSNLTIGSKIAWIRARGKRNRSSEWISTIPFSITNTNPPVRAAAPATAPVVNATVLTNSIQVRISPVANATRIQFSRQYAGNLFSTWLSIPLVHTFTGLAVGQTYTFKFRAVNAAGIGPESIYTWTTTSTDVNIPGAPTFDLAAASTTEINITNIQQVAGSSNWEYRYAEVGTEFGSWISFSGGLQPVTHTISGLDSGTRYQVQVRTTVNNIVSDHNTKTQITLPGAPAFTVHPNDVSALVTITDTPKGTEYLQVRWNEIGSDSVEWRTADFPFIVTGLSANGEFTVGVRAGNSAGVGAETTVNSRTLVLPGLPTTPVITWTSTIDSITYYVRSLGATTIEHQGGTDTTWIVSSSSTINVPLLQSGSLYTRRFRARSASGYSPGITDVTAYTLPKPTTVDLTATQTSISGTILKVRGAHRYEYQYGYRERQSDDVGYSDWKIANERRFTETGLSGGETYFVKVRTVGSAGPSAVSDPVSITTTTFVILSPPTSFHGSYRVTGNVATVHFDWGRETNDHHWHLEYRRKGSSHWLQVDLYLNSWTHRIEAKGEWEFRVRRHQYIPQDLYSQRTPIFTLNIIRGAPFVGIPPAPTLTFSSVISNRKIFTISAPPSIGSNFRGYILDYRRQGTSVWYSSIIDSQESVLHYPYILPGTGRWEVRARVWRYLYAVSQPTATQIAAVSVLEV